MPYPASKPTEKIIMCQNGHTVKRRAIISPFYAATYDPHLVRVLLADRPRVWAHERTLGVQDERERDILLLRSSTEPGEAVRKVQPVGRPRTRQEDKVVELHALWNSRLVGPFQSC